MYETTPASAPDFKSETICATSASFPWRMFKVFVTSIISLPKILLISKVINCAFLSFKPVKTTAFEPAFFKVAANFLMAASWAVALEASLFPEIALYKFKSANT